MAHELSNADAGRLVLRKKSAWHNLGNVIEDDLSAVEAGEQFGFFDPIQGWTLVAIGPNGEKVNVDTHKANVMVSAPDASRLRR
jgi:hypothetical protein